MTEPLAHAVARLSAVAATCVRLRGALEIDFAYPTDSVEWWRARDELRRAEQRLRSITGNDPALIVALCAMYEIAIDEEL